MSSRDPVDPRNVFVIHGRNAKANEAVFAFLRALDLNPIEWSEARSMTKKGSPYIGEILDTAFNNAQAIVVLQTPDDVAYLHESLTYPDDPETQAQMQPRANVLFEAGMALGRDEDRVIIVELGKVKVFSDIHGRHSVRLDNDIKNRQELANRLRDAGCSVKTTGTSWHEAGDLTPPAPPGGGLPMGRKLPSGQALGHPRLSAQFTDQGGNKLGIIKVTNHGPGDAYEVNIDSDLGLHPYSDGDWPVPKLPAGKSVSVMTTSTRRLGGSARASYATVILTAKTADGVDFSVEEFVSGL
jgi:Predicted nucleotide-binding protein containing TIR-like domain